MLTHLLHDTEVYNIAILADLQEGHTPPVRRKRGERGGHEAATSNTKENLMFGKKKAKDVRRIASRITHTQVQRNRKKKRQEAEEAREC